MKLLPTYQENPLPLTHTHTHSLSYTHLYSTASMDTQSMIMADPDNNYLNKNMPSSSFRPPHETGFELSDFFEFNDWIEEDPAFSPVSVTDYSLQVPSYAPSEVVVNSTGININNNSSNNNNNYHEGTINRDSGREKKEIREKVAFKTKSEVEVLDDGFKWRKYGKKMVKNSPNPRNYYRCSVEGCPVKKRVERDKEDPNYVVTTYEGIHTHQGPQL